MKTLNRLLVLVPVVAAIRKFLTDERRQQLRSTIDGRLPDRIGPVVIREPRGDRRKAIALVGLGTVVGGLIAYFFDPDRGRGRRVKAADMTAARLRRRAESMRKMKVRTENKMHGIAAELSSKAGDGQDINDPTLAHKIESEVLRDFPKGRINVNAEEGRVVLRGALDRPEQIRELEERVRRVPGVREVENLTHLVGSNAPRR